MLSLLLLSAFVFSVSFAQNLSWTPEKIMPGDKVSITYNPENTPLEGLETIVFSVYQFDDFNAVAKEMPLTNTDGTFTSSFTADESTKAILFSFTNEKMDKQDNNDKKGYKTICYQEDRKTPVQGAYGSKAYIIGQFSWIADTDRDNEKALKLLKKEFKHHPSSEKKMNYQSLYTNLGKANKDQSILDSSKEHMEKILKNKKATEEELNYAYSVSAYTLEDKEGAEKIKETFLKKYPTGKFAGGQLSRKMRSAKEIEGKIAIFDEYKSKFSHLEAAENTLSSMASQIASYYSKEKDWENFDKYFSMVTNKSSKAGALNSIAWPMTGESIDAEAKDAEKGKKLSMESLTLLKDEMESMSAKPKYFTKRQYKRNMGYSYAMYADTYALLAYHTDDMEGALKHQQIACDQDDFGNGEMAERYAVYYEKVHGGLKTEAFIADLLSQGKATSKMKEQHKRLYFANNTLESGYDKYVVQLEKSALEKKRNDLVEKMIEMPAPNFSLVNLEGEQVSLESLKGKVVVVDFWATWCGPCIASFPGMQKAVNKFENSSDVEFVFIDTWESGKEKEKNASKFISDNKYTFNVLMDNENTAVGEFGVSGIPTKFIVDKDGVIRFRSSGFNGNDDELVTELTMMIELAGGTIPAPLTGAP